MLVLYLSSHLQIVQDEDGIISPTPTTFKSTPAIKPRPPNADHELRNDEPRGLTVLKNTQLRRCSYDRRLSEEIRLLDVNYFRKLATGSAMARRDDKYSLRNMTVSPLLRGASLDYLLVFRVKECIYRYYNLVIVIMISTIKAQLIYYIMWWFNFPDKCSIK